MINYSDNFTLKTRFEQVNKSGKLLEVSGCDVINCCLITSRFS